MRIQSQSYNNIYNKEQEIFLDQSLYPSLFENQKDPFQV
jgi:hypothetical protein